MTVKIIRTVPEPTQSPRAAEVLAALATLSPHNPARAASDGFEVMLQQTGVLPFDVLLYGGLALGRVTLFTGQFSTLKSWLSLRAAAATQRAGGLAAIVDTEKSFDPVWAARQGVNVHDLIVMQPTVGEEALGVCEELLQTHDLRLLVWDSLAATLTTEQSLKRASEADKVATLARFSNRALQRLNTVNQNCAIIVINQVRTKIGVTFGSPDSYPGGNAQMFYAAQHLVMRKGEQLRAEEDRYRLGVRKSTKQTTQQVYEAILAKSKVGGPPYRAATVLWDPAKGGVDELAFAIDAGLDLELVTTNAKGSMFRYGDVEAAKGKRFYDKLAASGHAQQLMAEVLFAACPGIGVPK